MWTASLKWKPKQSVKCKWIISQNESRNNLESIKCDGGPVEKLEFCQVTDTNCCVCIDLMSCVTEQYGAS